jgi:hypothetical protein
MSALGRTLDAMVAASDDTPRVSRADVSDGDWLLVRTRNSVYTITVGPGRECLVSGGWFDRRGVAPAHTTVSGCTWGGSVIRVDLIAAVGLCIEFGNRLITTEARRIFHLRKAMLN